MLYTAVKNNNEEIVKILLSNKNIQINRFSQVFKK